MDKFLEKYNLPKLNEEEAETEQTNNSGWNWSSNQKTTSTQKPGWDSLTGEFYKAFKEELTPTLHRWFQKIQEDGRHPNSFYETNIILIPKPDKDTTKKEKYRPIVLMNIDAKILNKYWQTTSSNTVKRSYTMITWDSSQGCSDGTIFANQ